jgi:branched-chain amino acid transport system ATP-binding protein
MRLVVENLNAFYGRAQVLFDVSLKAGSHEVLALIGRNGAGKSTTFKSIVGLVGSRRGRIAFNHNINFDPVDISRLPVHQIVELGLGYVPEDRRIFTDLTVEENLDVGTQLPREGVPHWSKDRLFALFPNLAEMRKRPAGRMSGGEQQMLTIARSLMGNPSLIMLDEPSEGLAPKIVEDMAYAILAMKKEGLAVIISEQNLHFAKMISNRAYVIEKGRICYEGSMSELAANDEIRNKYLAV